MRTSGLPQFFLGLILIAFLPINSALAFGQSAWVSVAVGDDQNDCSIAAPCKTFARAITQIGEGGTISAKDPGDYGSVLITFAMSIVNDSGGTVTACCGGLGGNPGGNIVVAAGPNEVVTLRGLTFAGALAVATARQVNIVNCEFLDTADGAIVISPGNENLPMLTVAPSIDVSVLDTLITGNPLGIRASSMPGVHVTLTVERTRIINNSSAGIRADGGGGGELTVAVSDSTISFNAGNGVLALGGPGSAAVHVTRSVIASNTSSGVQSNQTNGGIAIVTVRGSTLTNNVNGAVNFFGGASLLTFGDNNIVGPNGTGFTGPIPLQ